MSFWISCPLPFPMHRSVFTGQYRFTRKGRDLIRFAAAGKHIGLYPGAETTAVFAEELTGYDMGRDTVRLPYDEELPAEPIVKIAQWCGMQYGK